MGGLIEISGDHPPSLRLICQACCDVLGLSAASLVLIDKGGAQGVTGASDARATAILDQEFTLGEGPVADANRQGRPILIGDIREAAARWPRFVPAVSEFGVRALYALPLNVGAIELGVLLLGRADPKALIGEELADALQVADLVSRLVLELQAGATSESLAWALDIADTRAVVHQATGMIAAQLNVGVDEALVRLRAHAFAIDRPINEIADQVVGGRKRFADR